MNELFPVIGGTLVGLCCGHVQGKRARTALWIAASLASGALATLVSGEYRLGPQYLAFDTGLAALAAVCSTAVSWLFREPIRGAKGGA